MMVSAAAPPFNAGAIYGLRTETPALPYGLNAAGGRSQPRHASENWIVAGGRRDFNWVLESIDSRSDKSIAISD